jgi:hypothetical protein
VPPENRKTQRPHAGKRVLWTDQAIVVADFLIGAHALHRAEALLTHDWARGESTIGIGWLHRQVDVCDFFEPSSPSPLPSTIID